VLKDIRAGLLAYRFRSLPVDAIDVVTSTRLGGISTGSYASLDLGLRVGDESNAVLENRRRFFAAYGLDLQRSVWCKQIHRDRVTVIGEGDLGRGAFDERRIVDETDAMVTDVIGATLCVTLADCVPVVIYDPPHHILGLAHAGWGGTVRRISSQTVREMAAHWGSNPAELLVGIGPSIAPEDYEVGDDVADQAAAAYGQQLDAVVRRAPNGKWLFDLWRANELDLIDAGVRARSIETARISTAAALDEFYSHRLQGPTGRFIMAATLRYAANSRPGR
jgi:YfiH family protein